MERINGKTPRYLNSFGAAAHPNAAALEVVSKHIMEGDREVKAPFFIRIDFAGAVCRAENN